MYYKKTDKQIEALKKFKSWFELDDDLHGIGPQLRPCPH